MPLDVAFFEKYLVICKKYFLSDPSHGLCLQGKFVSGLVLFLDLDIDCFSGLLRLHDSLYYSFCLEQKLVNEILVCDLY